VPDKNTLKSSAMFHGVSDKDLDLLVPMCSSEVAEEGATILTQGEPARDLYLVDEGRVGLHMTLKRLDGSGTGETGVASMAPPQAFGWFALIPPFVSTLSATAVELCQLIALDSLALRELLGQQRYMGYLVMKNVAGLVAGRLAESREALVYHRSYEEYLQRQSKGPKAKE